MDIDNEKYSDGNLKNPSLTLNNATFSDYGEYVCLAGNFVGENKSSASKLIVIGGKDITDLKKLSHCEEQHYNVIQYMSLS